MLLAISGVVGLCPHVVCAGIPKHHLQGFSCEANERIEGTYSVHVHRLQAQQVYQVLLKIRDTPPLLHLNGAQVMRRVYVAEIEAPGHLPHVILLQVLTAQLILNLHLFARRCPVFAASRPQDLEHGLCSGGAVALGLLGRWRVEIEKGRGGVLRIEIADY